MNLFFHSNSCIQHRRKNVKNNNGITKPTPKPNSSRTLAEEQIFAEHTQSSIINEYQLCRVTSTGNVKGQFALHGSESQFKINNVITSCCVTIIQCPTNWSIFPCYHHLRMYWAVNVLGEQQTRTRLMVQSNGTTQDAILLHEYYIASPGLFASLQLNPNHHTYQLTAVDRYLRECSTPRSTPLTSEL